MAIRTLYILTLQVVVLFTGMAVCTDIQIVRLTARHGGSSPVGPKNITVTTAEVGKIGATVNGAAAGIGIVNTVAGGAGNGAVFQVGIKVCG